MDSNQTRSRELMCVGGVCDGERHAVQGGPGTIIVLKPHQKEVRKLKFSELLERMERTAVQTQAYEVQRCVSGKDEVYYLCPAGDDFMQAIRHLIDCHRAPRA